MAELPQQRTADKRQGRDLGYMKVRNRDAIRRWRMQRGYSQEDLALLCRKTQQAVSKLENGTATTLTEAFAMDIAKRLGVDWHELFEDPGVSLSEFANPVHSDRAAS